MAEAVLLSIRPKWASLILNGQKKIEVRKSIPSPSILPYIYPFKIFLYATQDVQKVVGECRCRNITKEMPEFGVNAEGTCLTEQEIAEYADGKSVYFWHLCDVKKYDRPITLEEMGIKKPPQSWFYVNWREQVGEDD